MSLRPHPMSTVPAETARVAQAVYPKGNLYMTLRDELGSLYTDEDFADLFPTHGQPAACPWRLALICVLQFAEDLSDRQAAEAVRSRIDWKYALGLERTDPGFDFSVLSEFRARLVTGHTLSRLLDTLLERVRALGLLKQWGRQRTDSTHVLAAVRVLNRLERVGETLRPALNSLAVVAPAWLRAVTPPAWYDRYSCRVENYALPKTEAARQELAAAMGAEGRQLLAAIEATTERRWIQEIPAVQTLRRVWAEPYTEVEGTLVWREVKDMPSPLGLGQPLRYTGGASTAVRRLDFGRPRTAVTSAAINAWIKRCMCSRTTASNPSQIRFDVETCRVVCCCVAVAPFMAGIPSSGRGDSRGYIAFPLFPHLLVIPPRQTHIHGN